MRWMMASQLTNILDVFPRVIMSPSEISIGSLQRRSPESGRLTTWEFKKVPFRLPISTSSHFNFCHQWVQLLVSNYSYKVNVFTIFCKEYKTNQAIIRCLHLSSKLSSHASPKALNHSVINHWKKLFLESVEGEMYLLTAECNKVHMMDQL